MEQADSAQSVPRAGLRATIRYIWKEEKEPMMTRELFGKAVLLGALRLKVEDVFCLQSNNGERSFEVTFQRQEVCDRMLEESRRLAGARPLSHFEVQSLDRPNFRVVTVHMYNPYVSDVAVAAFLGGYAEVLTGARRQSDANGFWSGKRRFQVLLGQDVGGTDGLAHPPAFFNIGADRGYLSYARQPPFCRRCRASGHMEGACGTLRCRFCQATGHGAKDCPMPRACHICGSSEHLAKGCSRAYAAAAKGKGGGGRWSGGPAAGPASAPAVPAAGPLGALVPVPPAPLGQPREDPSLALASSPPAAAPLSAAASPAAAPPAALLSAAASPAAAPPAAAPLAAAAPPAAPRPAAAPGTALLSAAPPKATAPPGAAPPASSPGPGHSAAAAPLAASPPAAAVKAAAAPQTAGFSAATPPAAPPGPPPSAAVLRKRRDRHQQGVEGPKKQREEAERVSPSADTGGGPGEGAGAEAGPMEGVETGGGEEMVSLGVCFSPLGEDGYEGPLRPPASPNALPFSWADLVGEGPEEMSLGLYPQS